MLFNSYSFIGVFLPLVAIAFFGLVRWQQQKAALLWLMVASLFFYGYWKPLYLPLMLLSIAVNYFIGRHLERLQRGTAKARGWLWGGIIFNLALLGYYKYAHFVVASIAGIFSSSVPSFKIILPLAISFYSFTQIAYLVDAYRGDTQEYRYDLASYTLFISFFPQLIAGPIVRYNELVPQFNRCDLFIFNAKNVSLGLTLFVLGLFKKVAIADRLSPWVSPVFDSAIDVTFLEAWIGALAYTFQLYFDFSGYSDMAIGLGWIFNIDLPVNFNSPYKAPSIGDFWRRWHITLSNFLRDYLYIPLGGNRLGRVRQYLNLFVTMLLGGLWHGAGWTFVIWGGLHGLFLVVDRVWQKIGFRLPKLISWGLTFLAVLNSWVIFRAKTLAEGWQILRAMWGIQGAVLPTAYQGLLGKLSPFFGFQFQGWNDLSYLPGIGAQKSLLILLALLLFVTLAPNTQQALSRFTPTLGAAALLSVMAIFCLLSLNRVSEFLYFQF